MSAVEIPVPRALRRPHRFVAATRKSAKGARVGDDGRLELGGPRDVARLFVSRDQLRRALLILQGIYREAERRGYDIEWVRGTTVRSNGVAVLAKGHPFPVEIHELRDSAPMGADDIERWRERHRFMLNPSEPPEKKRMASGRLELRLPRNWDGRRASWTDGPRGLVESKLGSFFNELEAKADEAQKRTAEFARRQEERQLEEQLRREQLRRQRIEERRAAELVRQASAWSQARDIRAYANALRRQLGAQPDPDRQRLEAWCAWAAGLADRIDPLQNTSRIAGLDDPSQAAIYDDLGELH